jgi:murein DD-endopeptidase MepM/ murein hydrolase activator NlpD
MHKVTNWKKFELYLLKKIRINGLNATSYERLWGIELTRLSLIFLLLFFVLILFVLNILLIAYTPLKSVLPNEALISENNQTVKAQLKKIERLEKKVDLQTRYIDDFKNVILGKPIPSDKSINLSNKTINPDEAKLNNKNSKDEKKFMQKVENDIRESAFLSGAKQSAKGIFFFTPLNGVISSSYTKNHPGIDVVATKNSAIKSVFNGIVIFADWTQDNGYTIIVYHPNQFISIYKHNSALLKKPGDLIKSGDPIAIIGDTGENTSGTHLHFELLYEGKHVNPTEFISFQ